MRICLVTPFAWSQPHDVNDHVAGIAVALRGLGHSVTVLAPSTRAADLLAGRRALVRGEPAEVIAVGPAVPVSRRSQLGVPVGVQANLRQAIAQGSYDVVHGFDPGLPSLSYLALRDTDALAVATFASANRLGYPPARSQREKLLARLDALIAFSDDVRAAAEERFPGDYHVLSPGVDTDLFTPARKQKTIVVELRPNERVVARGIVRTLRELPGWDVVLLRTRPLIARPAIPRDLAGRVHTRTERDAASRAAVLNTAAIFVPGVEGMRRVTLEAAASGCAIVRPRGLELQPELAAAATARLAEDEAFRTAAAATPSPRLHASSRRSTPPSAPAAASGGKSLRSRIVRGSSPTCTCTRRGRTTAALMPPSSWTTPNRKDSVQSRSPITTSSAGHSKPPTTPGSATSSSFPAKR
jgi:phosphatidylinositol alpha-mannosyltransferase